MNFAATILTLGSMFAPSDAYVGCYVEQLTGLNDELMHFQHHGISPDGRLLAIGTYDGERGGAYLLNLETGRKQQLNELNNSASFSPDSKKLLLAQYRNGQSDIVEYDLKKSQMRILVEHSSWDFLPTYSFGGELILYNSHRSGRSDMYLFNRVTGDTRQLSEHPAYEANGVLLPDQNQFLFVRKVAENNHDIVLGSISTKQETLFKATSDDETYPAISPSGSHVAYVKTIEGNSADVFIADMHSDQEWRLTTSDIVESYLSFSPQMDWLYFNGSIGESMNVYRLKLNAHINCAS